MVFLRRKSDRNKKAEAEEIPAPEIQYDQVLERLRMNGRAPQPRIEPSFEPVRTDMPSEEKPADVAPAEQSAPVVESPAAENAPSPEQPRLLPLRERIRQLKSAPPVVADPEPAEDALIDDETAESAGPDAAEATGSLDHVVPGAKVAAIEIPVEPVPENEFEDDGPEDSEPATAEEEPVAETELQPQPDETPDTEAEAMDEAPEQSVSDEDLQEPEVDQTDPVSETEAGSSGSSGQSVALALRAEAEEKRRRRFGPLSMLFAAKKRKSDPATDEQQLTRAEPVFSDPAVQAAPENADDEPEKPETALAISEAGFEDTLSDADQQESEAAPLDAVQEADDPAIDEEKCDNESADEVSSEDDVGPVSDHAADTEPEPSSEDMQDENVLETEADRKPAITALGSILAMARAENARKQKEREERETGEDLSVPSEGETVEDKPVPAEAEHEPVPDAPFPDNTTDSSKPAVEYEYFAAEDDSDEESDPGSVELHAPAADDSMATSEETNKEDGDTPDAAVEYEYFAVEDDSGEDTDPDHDNETAESMEPDEPVSSGTDTDEEDPGFFSQALTPIRQQLGIGDEEIKDAPEPAETTEEASSDEESSSDDEVNAPASADLTDVPVAVAAEPEPDPSEELSEANDVTPQDEEAPAPEKIIDDAVADLRSQLDEARDEHDAGPQAETPADTAPDLKEASALPLIAEPVSQTASGSQAPVVWSVSASSALTPLSPLSERISREGREKADTVFAFAETLKKSRKRSDKAFRQVRSGYGTANPAQRPEGKLRRYDEIRSITDQEQQTEAGAPRKKERECSSYLSLSENYDEATDHGSEPDVAALPATPEPIAVSTEKSETALDEKWLDASDLIDPDSADFVFRTEGKAV